MQLWQVGGLTPVRRAAGPGPRHRPAAVQGFGAGRGVWASACRRGGSASGGPAPQPRSAGHALCLPPACSVVWCCGRLTNPAPPAPRARPCITLAGPCPAPPCVTHPCTHPLTGPRRSCCRWSPPRPRTGPRTAAWMRCAAARCSSRWRSWWSWACCAGRSCPKSSRWRCTPTSRPWQSGRCVAAGKAGCAPCLVAALPLLGWLAGGQAAILSGAWQRRAAAS